jgi:formylglycine-generating enzyme required for sulfatase activity
VITNVVATQRTGTKFFDITYDLASTTPTVKMSLEISSDGGATYTVPVTSATGAIGKGVAVGNGKSIVWNAGVDWDAKSGSQMRFRLIADNQIINGLSLIPAGAFTMGRTSGDTDTNAPPVTVNVSQFYMGKYEVTKALWDDVRTWAVANGYTDMAAGAGKAADHPVQMVSWWDVVKWCNARSQKEGLTPCYTVSGSVMKTGTTAPTVNWTANGYRLPTEAEWEKAARGGVSGKRFPWGTDTISHSQANYYASSSYSYDSSGSVDMDNFHSTYNDGTRPYTSPVGSFAANGYGLNDMAGNVWEWCWDLHEFSTYEDGATDPRGAIEGSIRALRGGSWLSYAVNCNAADRLSDYVPGNLGNYGGGFRIARSALDQQLIITTQPTSQAIVSGSTTTLTVTAIGSSQLTYQWYQGALGTTTTPVGTNSSSFTTPVLSDTTTYWVRVSNLAGIVNSTLASVTVTSIPADLALIPAGAFQMGVTSGDTYSDAPSVSVTVSAFYMGKYELTKSLWDEVRTWAVANGYTDLASGAGKATNHPVHSVSWWDAIKWCNARSEKEGLTPCYTVSGSVMKTETTEPTVNWTANGYRLPTEAEWEKAARGGVSGKRFPWGTDTISHSQANYYANYTASSFYSYDSSSSVRDFHPTYKTGSTPYTSPVGSFAANAYGLNDMAGNALEWCWDWYGESTYVNGATDPRGANSGWGRVYRGGGWSSYAVNCSAAARPNTVPTYQYSNIGFRIARSSVP